ncbi:MAG: MTAP family purine nucleoside phosphorylase, partial [Planctomycetes bacterium]|nr:MTAP family purine nucleoside phosphorylase [Planctomycetota bacterium]
MEQTSGTEEFLDTPFGETSCPVITTEWHSVPIAFISRHGKGHMLNPSSVPYQANIHAFKQLGVTHIIASGACGSLV